jgi:hypothetical protein
MIAVLTMSSLPAGEDKITCTPLSFARKTYRILFLQPAILSKNQSQTYNR